MVFGEQKPVHGKYHNKEKKEMNGLKEHFLFLVRSNKNNQNVRDRAWFTQGIVSF